MIEDPCPTCHGAGVERREREVKVRIPAGVDDGQRIRLKGRGGPGRNGGPPGDLYVTTRVQPHTIFGRKGLDLTLRVPVTYPEAALGAEIEVPTLDGGPVKLRINPSVPLSEGSPGEGPRCDATRKKTGDLLVTVRRGRAGPPVRGRTQGDRRAGEGDRRVAARPPGGVMASTNRMQTSRGQDPDRRHGVYVISVAAELAGVHPQTLRIYERKGLLDPARTVGGNRRYSEVDIDRLRRIAELTADGLNLAGVEARARARGRAARAARRASSSSAATRKEAVDEVQPPAPA